MAYYFLRTDILLFFNLSTPSKKQTILNNNPKRLFQSAIIDSLSNLLNEKNLLFLENK